MIHVFFIRVHSKAVKFYSTPVRFIPPTHQLNTITYTNTLSSKSLLLGRASINFQTTAAHHGDYPSPRKVNRATRTIDQARSACPSLFCAWQAVSECSIRVYFTAQEAHRMFKMTFSFQFVFSLLS